MPRKEFVFVRAEIDRKLKLKCDLSAFLRYLNQCLSFNRIFFFFNFSILCVRFLIVKELTTYFMQWYLYTRLVACNLSINVPRFTFFFLVIIYLATKGINLCYDVMFLPQQFFLRQVPFSGDIFVNIQYPHSRMALITLYYNKKSNRLIYYFQITHIFKYCLHIKKKLKVLLIQRTYNLAFQSNFSINFECTDLKILINFFFLYCMLF